MTDQGIQQMKSYEITYQEDGVFLTVYPPVGYLNKVNQNEVLNHIAKKGNSGIQCKCYSRSYQTP